MATNLVLEIDLSATIRQLDDGWWQMEYESFIGEKERMRPDEIELPEPDEPSLESRPLAAGTVQGGSRRVVVDSVTRHIREEVKQFADEHYGN